MYPMTNIDRNVHNENIDRNVAYKYFMRNIGRKAAFKYLST